MYRKTIATSEGEARKRLLTFHADQWCQTRRLSRKPVEYNALAVYLRKYIAQESWEVLLKEAREFIALWFVGESVRAKMIRRAEKVRNG